MRSQEDRGITGEIVDRRREEVGERMMRDRRRDKCAAGLTVTVPESTCLLMQHSPTKPQKKSGKEQTQRDEKMG